MIGQFQGIFPSSLRISEEGCPRHNKLSRSILYGADGVVIRFRQKFVLEFTHHPARAKDAGRLFLIAQPPLPRRGGESSHARKSRLQCETVQECEICGQTRQAAGQNEYPDGYHQRAADDLNGMKMLLETSVEGKELVQGEAGQ
jgi:hypothetical protein